MRDINSLIKSTIKRVIGDDNNNRIHDQIYDELARKKYDNKEPFKEPDTITIDDVEDAVYAYKREIDGEKKVVVTRFHASWCGPCEMYGKGAWKEAVEHGFENAEFVDRNIDEDDDAKYVLAELEVQSIPTTLFEYADGTRDVAKGMITFDQIKRRINKQPKK